MNESTMFRQSSGPSLLFDRALEPEWIDYALEQWIVNPDGDDHRRKLKTYLESRLQGPDAIRKSVNQLQRAIGPNSPIPPERLSLFYQTMSDLAPDARREIRLAILEESSVFFADCLNAFRRIALLGGGVTSGQIIERIISKHGDRSAVRRSAERALQTLGDLGVAQRQGKIWILDSKI